VGLEKGEIYNNLEHNLFGLSITKTRSSLPLISCAIFSSIAKRIDLIAHPTSYPFHVYLIVMSPKGRTLDGKVTSKMYHPDQTDEENSPFEMYLDPWRTDDEVAKSDLRGQLARLRVSGREANVYLSAMTSKACARRCSQNIKQSIHHLQMNEAVLPPMARNAHPILEKARYASMWVDLILGNDPRRLEHLITIVQFHWPMDVKFLEKWQDLVRYPDQHGYMSKLVHVIRSTDATPKKVTARRSDMDQVRFKVGQVVKHKRYGFIGAIIGWESNSGIEHTNETNQNGLLQSENNKTFYHVIAEDQTVRYLAESNMSPIFPDYPEGIFDLAGRYFRRWDRETKTFLSNIRDEYPDD
jgi:F-box protein 21